jgi:hypothetical protein
VLLYYLWQRERGLRAAESRGRATQSMRDATAVSRARRVLALCARLYVLPFEVTSEGVPMQAEDDLAEGAAALRELEYEVIAHLEAEGQPAEDVARMRREADERHAQHAEWGVETAATPIADLMSLRDTVNRTGHTTDCNSFFDMEAGCTCGRGNPLDDDGEEFPDMLHEVGDE